MEDTIAAIATAVGVGAISIIRVSGNNAIKNVNKIFKGTDLEKVASHTINYGHIIYNDEIIDEVLVSVMRTPKTFTHEATGKNWNSCVSKCKTELAQMIVDEILFRM